MALDNFAVPYSFGYDFAVNKGFTYNAVKYSPGQAFPHDGAGERVTKEQVGITERQLFKFYKQRLVHPLIPEGAEFFTRADFDAAVHARVAEIIGSDSAAEFLLIGGASVVHESIATIATPTFQSVQSTDAEDERDDTDLAEDDFGGLPPPAADPLTLSLGVGLSAIALSIDTIAADDEAMEANAKAAEPELDDAPPTPPEGEKAQEPPPPPEGPAATPPAVDAKLVAEHEGFGKWFVMQDGAKVAGPFVKAVAKNIEKTQILPAKEA